MRQNECKPPHNGQVGDVKNAGAQVEAPKRNTDIKEVHHAPVTEDAVYEVPHAAR